MWMALNTNSPDLITYFSANCSNYLKDVSETVADWGGECFS